MKSGIICMRKRFFVMLFLFPFVLSAQTTKQTSEGKKIRNLVSAVKAADPGDYILLPSGKKYVLTAEEIAIVKGEFDYKDLSGVKTETRDDGTKIKTISEAHTAYVYPDGQATHILKTSVSFTAYLQYIEDTYYITRYVDILGNYHDSTSIESARFKVFRGSVQFQTISNGIEDLESVTITAYNYQGRNFIMKYCSKQDMIWGNISTKGSYKPVGESHEIEFDIE